MAYHSRSRMKEMLDFYSELLNDLPPTDLDAAKCESDWAIGISGINKYLEQFEKWKTESGTKKGEYETSFTELSESIKSAYPCDDAYTCNFVGKLEANFMGNKLRKVCVSEESAVHGEEACRAEQSKENKDFSIVRAHDDTKYLCQNDVVFTVGAPPEVVSDLDDSGNLTTEAQAK